MFVYWILFPLLFAGTLVGLGLGLRRLTLPFSAGLLLPTGYAIAVVITSALTWSSATPGFAGPLVVLLGIVGWIFGYKDLKNSEALRRGWPWVLVAFAAFLAFGASSIAVGYPTFTGSSQIVDIAHQFDFAWWLGHHGRDVPADGISAATNVVNRTLLQGYPSGPQGVLGTFPRTFGLEIRWAWQPMLATLAASVALGAYELIRQATASRRVAALGGFAAGQASVLISYGMIGGIKELAAVVAVLLSAALIPVFAAEAERKAWRAAVPIAVALAAAFSIFSLTLMPWIGLIGLGAMILTWRTVTLRAALIRGGIAVVLAAFLAIPTIVPAFKALEFAKLMSDPTTVGNLADPVSKWAATGVWLASDHRFSLTGPLKTISIIIGVLVILLAIVGAATAIRRKAFPILILAVASYTGMTILLIKMGAWVDLKALCVASPVTLILAAIGLSAFLTVRIAKYAAWTGLVGLVVVGLTGDALRYGSASLDPHERMSELKKWDDRYAGSGGTLHPDWDEQAEYELRRIRGVSPFNFPFMASEAWEKEKPSGYQYQWDLDQLDLAFVTIFDKIVLRRGPGISRPPRIFQQLDQGRYYTLWQRTKLPPVGQHLALTGLTDEAETAKCQAFIDKLPAGSTVTIAPSPTVSTTVFDASTMSKNFEAIGESAILTKGPGKAKGTVDIGQTPGLYEVYVNALSSRKTTITVDGHKYVMPVDRTYVIRPLYVGTVDLAAGPHEVTVEGGGTSLRPGTSKKAAEGTSIGPVALVPAGQLHPELYTGPAETTKCPAGADWVETP